MATSSIPLSTTPRGWTADQVNHLREYYGHHRHRDIATAIGKSGSSVLQMAMKLGINKVRYHEWTAREVNILRTEYRTTPFDELCHKLHPHTKSSIKHVARDMGLKRQSKGMDLILADLSVLLNESNVSLYWLGFLLADGHFSRQNRLRLLISIKDRDHLAKFGRFIGFKGEIKRRLNAVCIAVMDQWWVSEIKKRYDIANDKTYRPPCLDRFGHLNDDQMMAIIIGFIDGDGSIIKRKHTKTCNLAIKNHASWLPFLNHVAACLERMSGIELRRARINALGYASLIFSNHPLNKFVKAAGQRMGLPVLDRKWSRIDDTHINRYEQRRKREPVAIDMLRSGVKYSEIREATGFCESVISKIATKHGLRRKGQSTNGGPAVPRTCAP